MTREEMINFGEMFLEVNEDSKNSNIYEFIEKALGLLKQEPCEDCVSRQEIDQNIYDYAESNGLSYANMKNYILDTPSVTPTRKKGKWIERELVQCHIRGDRKILVCSNCNLGIANGILGFANFCPTCGADMRGNKE